MAEQSSDAHEILADHQIPNDEVQVSPLLQSNLSIEDRVFDNLINNCGISPTARTILLLSVSGGVDSMALLHIMGRLKLRSKLKNIDVHVINFNHKARVESDEEVYLVQSQANLYNMSFYSREINQSELRHEKPGFQEFARDWRQIQCRDLLNTLSYEQKYTVMGHQEDDQPETILLKLLRGIFNFLLFSYFNLRFFYVLCMIRQSHFQAVSCKFFYYLILSFSYNCNYLDALQKYLW